MPGQRVSKLIRRMSQSLKEMCRTVRVSK